VGRELNYLSIEVINTVKMDLGMVETLLFVEYYDHIERSLEDILCNEIPNSCNV